MPKIRNLLALSTILALSGCQAIAEQLAALAGLADLSLVGVTPAKGYADPESGDHGMFFVALSAENDKGKFLAPALKLLEVKNGQGEALEVEESEQREGKDQGSMFILVDGSGSLSGTDSGNHRQDAVALLAQQLAECSSGWRMTLHTFESSSIDEIVPWTENLDEIEAGATQLGAGGSTNLYDATTVAIDMVDSDVDDNFSNKNAAGKAVVVISDGADTSSSSSLDDALDVAETAGIPVHTVGLGPASDQAMDADFNLVGILQEFSEVSEGVYGAASEAADLPRVAEAIAQAHCGGYSVLVVKDSAPAEQGEDVEGSVGVKGTDIKAPYKFVAP
jgi:uncharacterized protein YegL